MVNAFAERHAIIADQEGVWDADYVVGSKLHRSCELLQECFLRRDSFALPRG